jgi:hypothetical protein
MEKIRRNPKLEKKAKRMRKIHIPSSEDEKEISGVYHNRDYHFLAYLQYKHKNNCSSKSIDRFLANRRYISGNNWGPFYKNRGGWLVYHNHDLWYGTDFFININKCLKEGKRFIIFPLQIVDNIDESVHINILIYDSKKNSMERFEPYGVNEKQYLSLDDDVKELFEEVFGDKFIKDYYKPFQLYPSRGFQKIQENETEWFNRSEKDPWGFCYAWSLWYADLRLSNPDKNQKNLIEDTLHELEIKPRSLTAFIRNYFMFIQKLGEDIQRSPNRKKTLKKIIKTGKYL